MSLPLHSGSVFSHCVGLAGGCLTLPIFELRLLGDSVDRFTISRNARRDP